MVPLPPLLGLAAGLGLCAALVGVGWIPRGSLGVAAVTAGHGALLSLSLGRAAAVGGWAWTPNWPALGTIALLGLGAGGATLGPGGAVAHLALPVWLLVLAGGGRLAALGMSCPVPIPATLAGLGMGTFLGAHLLLSAPLTVGYRLRQDGLAAWLGAFAYDLGANVPSSELFFRGALFDHVQRRRSLAAGALVATAAYVLRYLLDPRLPGTTEAVVAAIVYLSLLSLGNCWLFWWSGSLVPALASALVFFAAYRALGVG